MKELITSFLSSRTSEQISCVLSNDYDYQIDNDERSVDNCLEFKEHDLQENYWHIDEAEDCFIKEQLLFNKVKDISFFEDDEPHFFSEKTQDYTDEDKIFHFLKRKRILKASKITKHKSYNKMSNKIKEKVTQNEIRKIRESTDLMI